MWPYTNDEATWLTPPEPAKPKAAGSANDNDPARHVAPRPLPEAPPAPRKAADET
jgi:hypothetical protein